MTRASEIAAGVRDLQGSGLLAELAETEIS